jgi:hypothetical protein
MPISIAQLPVFLAINRELGEGPALWLGPELADALCSLEVVEHQNVEQFGTGSGTEGV